MNFNKKNKPKSIKSAFERLTTAALILPGLFHPGIVHATDEDEVDFQYSHYQEGKRDIYVDDSLSAHSLGLPGSIVKAPNALNPIEVDTLVGKARISLTDRVKFAFNYTQDTWGGATPIATAPVVTGGMRPLKPSAPERNIIIGATPFLNNTGGGLTFLDLNGNFYDSVIDPTTYVRSAAAKNNQLTHTLVSASPETRQQGDFKLNYDWDESSVSVGGGISVENDYESRFGNLGTRFDLNQKRTSINWGLSYTNSDTRAKLDPYSIPFTSAGTYGTSQSPFALYTSIYSPLTEGTLEFYKLPGQGAPMIEKAILTGNRQDWATDLGLTQVLSKNSELDLGLGYTHSGGFLSNPYKAVYVFNIAPAPGQDANLPSMVYGGGQMEARPHERNQITGNLGYHYYLEAMNAGLHGSYHVFHDDWSITSHTFDADWVQPLGAGWTVTPNVRYYSQSAADFYAPYFTTVDVRDPLTEASVASPLNKEMPRYYSSDQRLSGFGALSGGVTVAKQFAKGVTLEAGFEYYTHQGSLKLGGGGEQDFANYDYWTANAALKLNLGALHFSGGSDGHNSAQHNHADHTITPAGIMFNHALSDAGDMMVGYRYMRNEQAGEVLNGSTPVSNDQVALYGCGGLSCAAAPNYMVMNMHMLDLMIAPTDWLTLMLMPQWTDMDMSMTPVGEHSLSHHTNKDGLIHAHQSGGVGDTGLYALFKLFDRPGHQLVLSLGGTAPTGAIDITRRVANNTASVAAPPLHYGMQLGSGTWDIKPSLTYTGSRHDFGWGAQATGTVRLDTPNEDGYALGDIFQSSVWGGYQWSKWLSTTVRGVYNWQDQIQGEYPRLSLSDGTSISYAVANNHRGPMDITSNYGGQHVDLGLGVNVTVPSGTFAGNTIKFEWLQPVHTDYNSYQLDRSAALTATWGVGF